MPILTFCPVLVGVVSAKGTHRPVLTMQREIMPYTWVHPDEDDRW
jgi:hypothetical protein